LRPRFANRKSSLSLGVAMPGGKRIWIEFANWIRVVSQNSVASEINEVMNLEVCEATGDTFAKSS